MRWPRKAAKPLFLVDQFKVVMKNMNGEPVLPTDDDYSGVDHPDPAAAPHAPLGARGEASPS